MKTHLVSACAALAAILAGSASADAPPARPNVLFIAVDDLNNWVGCMGGHPLAKTPNMDRLAARGTAFVNAHCQAPLCNPSRVSLLTGKLPSTTGVYALEPTHREAPAIEGVVTLPQHVKAAGYRTMACGKIWHNVKPKDRPAEFDVWGPPAAVGARPPQKLVTTPGGNHPLVDWGAFPHRDEDKGDWKLADWTCAQLRDGPPEPFFLACGFFLPHVPCYVTQKWLDLYPDDDTVLPPVLPGDRDDVPAFAWYLHWKLPEPRLSWLKQSGQWRPLCRAYLASVSFVDSQIGRLLDALDASGKASNTVVVLWGDNGWHLGEKDVSGKNTLWDPGTRVPLIFAGPGVARGRCTQAVGLIDIYPTLVDLCGLPPRDGLEGHSLGSQLRDAAAPRRWPAITTHNPGNHTIRTERWRYTRYADGSEELYDMQADPREWKNLAGDESHASIKRELAAWAPPVSAPPAPGSHSRLLVKEGDQWMWENAPIIDAELER